MDRGTIVNMKQPWLFDPVLKVLKLHNGIPVTGKVVRERNLNARGIYKLGDLANSTFDTRG
ncbi:hypothetical protein ACFPYJ_05635 [Paenibacillus solisilvae]|uniref:Uncharacterized protein n=1 Tax=Paenibacillus solisilvae TaxID=2486751 RepID=A0ABW0VRX6_9BACL